MASGQRRSSRNCKCTKNSDFVYEEELDQILKSRKTHKSSDWQLSYHSDSNTSDSAIAIVSVNSNLGEQTSPIIANLPIFVSESYYNNGLFPSESADVSVLNSGQSQNPNTPSVGRVQISAVNVNIGRSDGKRTTSSTRGDFLELEGNFLSAGSSTAISEMSGSETEGASALPVKCSVCGKGEFQNCAVCASADEVPLARSMMAALEQIQVLTGQVASLVSVNQAVLGRLSRLEGNRNSDYESASAQPSSDQAYKSSHKSAGKIKSKKNRVEEEGARYYSVVQDNLRSLNRSKEKTEHAGKNPGELGLHDGLQSLSLEQKKEVNRKVANILKGVGGSFPPDGSEDSSSSSSGKESDGSRSSRRRRHRRKVKSGAKIKTRPVVKTELWPHTVSNENDGADVSSEDITLAKFSSSFTLIMTMCQDKVESVGRVVLLHAIFMILEHLPWTEARLFHNMVMLKLEQNRIDWNCKFTTLADDFLLNKLKQNLRGKATPSNSGSSHRTNNFNNNGYRSNFNNNGYGPNFNNNNGYGSYHNNNGYGRGSSYNGNRYQAGIFRPHTNICWQWNNGTCSYGERCKRWHCCRTCADSGKLGEPHKASSHSAGARSQGDQRF